MQLFLVLISYYFLGSLAEDASKNFKRFSSILPRSVNEEYGREHEKKSNPSLFTTSTNKSQSNGHAFVPIHYDIELEIGLVNMCLKTEYNPVRFPGKVKIFGVSQMDISYLQVNVDIDLWNRSSVDTSSIQVKVHGKSIPVKSYDRDFSKGLLIINFDKPIEAGKEIIIYIEYTTVLRNADPFGLIQVFGARYGDYDDCFVSFEYEQFLLMITNFNKDDMTLPTGCSNLFPCIDDHLLKSTFIVTLIRDKVYETVANGELVSSSPSSECRECIAEKFQWTTRIRPAMLAFAISKNYNYIERNFGTEKKIVRIYAIGEHINTGFFGFANASANILTYYEDYFGASSHLNSMAIFIVQTFGALKVENFGISVYALFVNGKTFLTPNWETQSTTQIQMTERIASDLALQWVGPWWDPEKCFKLANSLPRYMEYLGLESAIVDKAEGGNSIADLAVLTDLRNLENQTRVPAQTQIQEWNKGALLLQMMEGILSREILRQILQPYFKFLRRENETMSIEDFNPDPENLFEEFANFAMSMILNSFIENVGVPLARIGVNNETHFSITQEAFGGESSETWALPLTALTSKILGSETFPELSVNVMLPTDKMIFVEGNTSEIFLFNQDGKGYYRTLYENSTLIANIQSQLELHHEGISPLGRAKLLGDYFTFAEKGYCSYGDVFNLTTYMNNSIETSLAVWTTFLDKVVKVYSKFLSHPQYPKLAGFLLPKIDNVLRTIEPPYSLSESTLRESMLYFACRFQSPYCVVKAQTLFAEYHGNHQNGTSPSDSIKPAKLRYIFDCAIVATGGQQAVDFMFAKYQKEDHFHRFLRSLACAKEEEILQELLHKTLLPPGLGGFGLKDGKSFINFLIHVPLGNGRASIIPFIKNNFENFVEKLGDGKTKFVVDIISETSRYFSTKEQLDEVTELIRQHKDEILSDHNNQKQLDEAYEVFENNINWMNTYGKDILSSLEAIHE